MKAKANNHTELKRLSARWIIPVKGDPIPNGCIVTHSQSVQFIGSIEEASSRFPEAERIHHPGKAILPGLVNAHCHLDNGFLKNQITLPHDETFFDWIRKVIATQRVIPHDKKKEGMVQGVAQLKESGTVAVGDITHDPFTLSLLREAGLAAVCFHEVVGFLPEEAEDIYRDKRECLAKFGKSPGLTHYISPHAPYSASRELLRKIAEGRERVAFHLAESRDEVEFLQRGNKKMEEILKALGKWDENWKPPGLSPIRYFHEAGLLHHRAVAVHMVYVAEEDYPILEETKPNICLCPRGNTRLKNGLPPVRAYREMGLNLCLGTDGLGSNEDLSLLNEMRYLKKCFPDLEDAAIVRMGTVGGAVALGLEERFGVIEPGKADKFLIVDCAGEEEGPYSFL
ncbi:MAG: amidohydrolase family protein [Nitrospinae bacterium]|nr:amidohydrolase family protein [Nitrospinota bacterium]